MVADRPSALDEPAFAEAVWANLARGPMLALAVVDGVRSEAETLAGLLQSHAGARFTSALVELAVYRGREGELLVVSSTLLKTLLVERAVLSWQTQEVAQRYKAALAAAIGGKVAQEPGGALYLSNNGRSAPTIEQLLPPARRRLGASRCGLH